MKTDIHMENTDVREVGFHPPQFIWLILPEVSDEENLALVPKFVARKLYFSPFLLPKLNPLNLI